METNFTHSQPKICRRKDFICDLKEYKVKQKTLGAEFAKEFEECSKDLKNIAFLKSILSNVEDVNLMKRKTLAVLENHQSANPVEKTFNVYKNYDEAIERLWKYYENDIEDLSTDALFDMQHLQKNINESLEEIIKKIKRCNFQEK